MQTPSVQIVIGQKHLENVEYFKYLVGMIKKMTKDVNVKLNPRFPWK